MEHYYFPSGVSAGFRKDAIIGRLLGHIACKQCTGCDLLLQMSHVAWSVCLCVCVGHSVVLCKSGRTDQDNRLRLTFMCPRNHVLAGGQDQTNPFAVARGDK